MSRPKQDPPKGDPPAPPAAPDLGPSGFASDVLASLGGDDPERIFDFADRLSNTAPEVEETPRRIESWVSFELAGETFALPVEPVAEVLRISSITRVPHAPAPIRGVTNVRGRVIPVIDLRLRIELPEAEIGRGSRVMVVTSRGRLLGLLVDAVLQVVHLDMDEVQPPPDDVMTSQSDYLVGVYHLGDQLVMMLDVDRTLVLRQATAADEASAGDAADD